MAMTTTVSIFRHEIVWKKASPIIVMSLCSNLMELAKIDYIYWMKDLFYIFRVTPSDLSSTLVPSISAVHRRAILSVCSGTLLEYRIDSGGESLRMKKRLKRNYLYILKYRVYRPIRLVRSFGFYLWQYNTPSGRIMTYELEVIRIRIRRIMKRISMITTLNHSFQTTRIC